MTLDEAIQHCKEKAKELSDKAYQEWGVSMTEGEAYDCNECAREHEQLAKWLEDYKRLLEERPQASNNAELFKQTFGFYATEVWSMRERDFLEWLNSEVKND